MLPGLPFLMNTCIHNPAFRLPNQDLLSITHILQGGHCHPVKLALHTSKPGRIFYYQVYQSANRW